MKELRLFEPFYDIWKNTVWKTNQSQNLTKKLPGNGSVKRVKKGEIE